MFVDGHVHVRFRRLRVRWKGRKQTFPTKKTNIKNIIYIKSYGSSKIHDFINTLQIIDIYFCIYLLHITNTYIK